MRRYHAGPYGNPLRTEGNMSINENFTLGHGGMMRRQVELQEWVF
jgi:hypothetical protein